MLIGTLLPTVLLPVFLIKHRVPAGQVYPSPLDEFHFDLRGDLQRIFCRDNQRCILPDLEGANSVVDPEDLGGVRFRS